MLKELPEASLRRRIEASMTVPTAIRDVEFFRAKSTRTLPIADATHQIREISFVITRITLANGITGESYLLSFHYSPHAIAGALRDDRREGSVIVAQTAATLTPVKSIWSL
jgi:hypothetical protein